MLGEHAQSSCAYLQFLSGIHNSHMEINIDDNYGINIGIKHGYSCINIRQVSWKVLKTEAEGRSFQHLPRDLANVNALKNHVRSLLLHEN